MQSDIICANPNVFKYESYRYNEYMVLPINAFLFHIFQNYTHVCTPCRLKVRWLFRRLSCYCIPYICGKLDMNNSGIIVLWNSVHIYLIFVNCITMKQNLAGWLVLHVEIFLLYKLQITFKFMNYVLPWWFLM